jgi:GTPase
MTSIHRCGYVAIVGRPNVGKSTLLNRLVGQKLAITSHKPQTTRHSLLGIKTRPGGQILFVDTPGIHQRGEGALNRHLNRTARSALRDVDLVIWVVEALGWTREDALVLEALAGLPIPCIAAVNKTDRCAKKTELLPFLDTLSQRREFQAIVPISARQGEQLEVLEHEVLSRLPPRDAVFPEDQLSDRPQRFFAAELLREQLTRRYAQELPYQLSVEIERFQEEGRLYRIYALIWVERPAQKAIIIGHQGAALKATAQAARLEMERFFDCKVYLEVWVKVKESWSSDEGALANLGY